MREQRLVSVLVLVGLVMAGLTGLSTLAAGAATPVPPRHPTQSHVPPPTLPGGGETGYGSISGHVVIDANQNGLPDLGEIGYGGALVTLDNGGGLAFTSVTDGNGVFGFNSLSSADWILSLSPPPGYAGTTATLVGGLTIDGLAGTRLVVDFGIIEGQAPPTQPPQATVGTPGTRAPTATVASPTPTATETPAITATQPPTATPVDIEATIRAAVQATVRIAQSLQTQIAAVTASAAPPTFTPSETPAAPPSATVTPVAEGESGVGVGMGLVLASWVVLSVISVLALVVAVLALRLVRR